MSNTTILNLEDFLNLNLTEQDQNPVKYDFIPDASLYRFPEIEADQESKISELWQNEEPSIIEAETQEEYVDPFAVLLEKIQPRKDQFVKRLQCRRKKLDMLAKSLSRPIETENLSSFSLQISEFKALNQWQLNPSLQVHKVNIPELTISQMAALLPPFHSFLYI